MSVPVPPHLAEDWLVWRPIREKMLTWSDVTRENGIDLAELLSVNDLLDLEEDLQAAQAREAKRGTHGNRR